MMDIWSSDDEETKEGIDVWEGQRQWVVEHMASTEQKKEKKKKELVKKDELEVKPKIEEKEELKKELFKKTVSSIWELLIQSKIHRDAMV